MWLLVHLAAVKTVRSAEQKENTMGIPVREIKNKLATDEAQAGIPQQVQTYPAGAKTGPGLQTSDPMSSGGNATDAVTPVGNGANESQDVGSDSNQFDGMKDRGTPDQKIESMVAGEIEDKLMQSAQHVAGMKPPEKDGALSQDPELNEIQVTAKRRQVGELMSAQGANPKTALEKLRDKKLKDYQAMAKKGEITNKQHGKLKFHWKNIFNHIPEEDFGLVLMDFGFRAMMAGETMGSAAAIGAAGSGALAGVAGRKEAAYQRDVEQYNMASEGALAETQQARTSNETINTEAGVMEWDAESGSYKVMKDEDGNPIMPSALAGRPSTKDWEIKQWMSSFPDMSEQEATSRALSGVTPEEATLKAEDAFSREFTSGEIFIPGKGRVRARDITEADKKAYIDNRVRGGTVAVNNQPALGGGGGSGATGKLTRQQFGGTDAEWAEYNELYEQYGTQ